MIWNNLMWALLGALALALAGTAAAWWQAVRRRRAHAALLRDSVARMFARLPGEHGVIARLTCDVVDVLVRQDRGAALLDDDVRSEKAERLVSASADTAMLVSADAATTPHPMAHPFVEHDDEVWQAGRAPRASDHPELAELCAEVRQTTEHRITGALLVVAQADRLGDPEDADARAMVRQALGNATAALREADALTAAGEVLAALRVLTGIALPVPEDGVPGQADVPAMRLQTNALAKLALRQREALAVHRGATTVLMPEENA